MITPTSPSTAAEAPHIIRAAQLADYIPRRALARHVEVFDSEFDQWIAENAAWIIRCVRAGDRQPRGAHRGSLA